MAVERVTRPVVFAFDLETTGLRANVDRIIEVAVIECVTGEEFSTLVNPGHTPVPKRITQITEITKGMVSAPDVPGFMLAAERMEQHIAQCLAKAGRSSAPVLLAAHNCRNFDVGFLVAEYERAGRTLPADWQFVDTLPLAQALVRGPANHKLVTLHSHFGLGTEKAHRAAADARMVRNILGSAALGGLLKDGLVDRLLQEAFRPAMAISYIAREKTTRAAVALTQAPSAILDAAEQADELDVEESDLGDEADGTGAEDGSKRKPSASPRRAAALSPAMLKRAAVPPRADPLFTKQALSEGAQLSGDHALAATADAQWQDLPLTQFLQAESAMLFAPTFNSLEQLLRHYPTRFEECTTTATPLAAGAAATGSDAALIALPSRRAVTPCWPALADARANAHWKQALEAALSKAAELEQRRGDWLECVLDADEWTRLGLMSGAGALRALHQPQHYEQVVEACRRLAFEELFLLQVSLLNRRALYCNSRASAAPCHSSAALEDILASLSRRQWTLTQAQRIALNDVLSDMARSTPMLRLLTGDVQSGKSIVACMALLAAHDTQLQGVWLAASDAHAEQLYAHFQRLMQDGNVAPARRPRVVLMTSAMSDAERQTCLEAFAHADVAARAHIAIATHSVTQAAGSLFDSTEVGLVVSDEVQHAAHSSALLSSLAKQRALPHFLVVLRTPVPRALALAAYGDFVVSALDNAVSERAAAFAAVETHSLDSTGAARAMALAAIRAQVAAGGQVLMVYPSRPASASDSCAEAVSAHAELCGSGGWLAGVPVGLLHRDMTPDDRTAALAAFITRTTMMLMTDDEAADLAGVLPAASLLVVEHAQRFGLTQLHMLRCRVERGARCLLLYDAHGADDDAVAARLALLNTHATAGLSLAQEDLCNLGPAALLSAERAQPYACLKLASLSDDVDLLDDAREAAAATLLQTPSGKDSARAALQYALQSRDLGS